MKVSFNQQAKKIQLIGLKGAPKKVRHNFYCIRNKTKFTKEDVRAVCDVKMDIYT